MAPDETLGNSDTLASGDDETQPPYGGARPRGPISSEPGPPLPVDPAHLPLVSPSVYVLLDEVGRGGLGRIVRARDTRTGRLVAIKEMHVDSVDAATRFVREALVTANLQHPAIVPVYEVGRWSQDRPFYAMKLVTGKPLSQVIAGAPTLDARLALLPHVIDVAWALAHAHGERVIHRDLKPANVMIGAHGETVVIDWGLARRLGPGGDAPDADSLPPIGGGAPGETVVGAILGTPQFMAPEQARGERVDERADVYAIGAMLYHLLAGRPPFDKLGSVDAVLEAVRTRAPVPVATLAPDAPRELIAIVDRAMARDRDTRYATADALADDLRRFTTGKLVSAHSYSRGERVRRFVRRYRAVLASAAIALVALAITGAISVQRVLREREAAQTAERGERMARAEAERQRTEAQQQLAGSLVERARNELEQRRPGRAAPLLDEAARLSPDRRDVRFLRNRAAAALPEVHTLGLGQVTALQLLVGGDVVLARPDGVERRSLRGGTVRWSIPLAPVSDLLRDGDTTIALTDRGVVVLALADGRELARVGDLDAAGDVLSVELSAGRWLALKNPHGIVEVWDLPARRLVGRLSTGMTRGYAVASPDGQRVAVTATGDQPSAYLFDVRSGRRLRELCPPVGLMCTPDQPPAGEAIVLVRDTAKAGGEASIFDWNGERRFTIETVTAPQDALISSRFRLVVVLAADGTILAHDLDSGQRRWSSSAMTQGARLALDEAGGRMWAYGRDGQVLLVDLATGAELGWWWSAQSPWAMFVGPDAAAVAFVDRGLEVSWFATGPSEVTMFAPTAGRVWRAGWLDEARLVTGSADGTVAIHDAATGAVQARLYQHGARVSDLAVLPDGRVVTAGRDARVILWDPAAGRAVWTLDDGGIRATPSPDGKQLAGATVGGVIFRYPIATPSERQTLGTLPRDVTFIRWSPDGRWLAAMDDGGTVVVWRASDGAEVRRVLGAPANQAGGVDLAFSPDSRWLLAGRMGPRVLLDLHGGPDRTLESGDETLGFGLAFSDDGRRVAMSDMRGEISVWSVESGLREVRLDTDALATSLRFSADGNLLIAGSTDHTVRVWDLAHSVVLATHHAVDEVYGLSWSPDRTRLTLITLSAAATWRPPHL